MTIRTNWVRPRYVLMRHDFPEAVFTDEQEAEAVADRLNDNHDNLPWRIERVQPDHEVRAAVARIRKVWASADGEVHSVGSMDINHLTNSAHLCLTWQERFGAPMTEERRAMCQNVRDEIVRRKINEVGK
jgi:hypothetical protein